jgi:hypothetical protein
VFGVPSWQIIFTPAWNFMAINSPGWETGNLTRNPFAVIGLAAAARANSLAKAQMASIEKKKLLSPTALITINNELGFTSVPRAYWWRHRHLRLSIRMQPVPFVERSARRARSATSRWPALVPHINARIVWMLCSVALQRWHGGMESARAHP